MGLSGFGVPTMGEKHRSISVGWGTALVLYPALGEGMGIIAFLYSLLDKSSGMLSVLPFISLL